MKKLITSIIALCLTACSSTGDTDTSKKETNEKKYKFETRTYLTDTCLLSESKSSGAAESLGAALLGVLVPKALEYGIDKVSKELKEIKKEETTSSSEVYLYHYNTKEKDFENKKPIFPKFNPHINCLLTVSGNFLVKDSKGGDIAKPSGIIKFKNSDIWSAINFTGDSSKKKITERLDNFGIKLKDGQDGLFSVHEAKIEYADDNSAFRLDNQYLDVRKTLQDRTSVGMAYTLKISGPGTSPYSKVYATIPISFGKISSGTVYVYDKDKPNKSGWVSIIPMSTTSLAYFFKHDFGKVTCKNPAQLNCTKNYMPAQISVTNTQTKEPSEISKFLGEVLSASKDTLVESFNEKYFPDEGALETALMDAEIAVKTALVAISDAGEDTAKLDLANAQLTKACKSLKLAGGHSSAC